MYNIVDLNCPGCGASLSSNKNECDFCGRNIIITSFSSIYSMSSQDLQKLTKFYSQAQSNNPDSPDIFYSAGMCYLKTKMYEKAQNNFDKTIELNFDHSDAYFFSAIALLRGKKPFLAKIDDIRRAENYLNTALSIENKGIYRLLLSYIKYDFYHRKCLNVSPDYMEELTIAKMHPLPDGDVSFMFDVLNVSPPDFFLR